MMNEVAISVRDVSKKYRLFHSPQERLKEALHPFRKRYHREFWALKGVSLDVPRGQTVGILGRNGSGKSTLLQIIAGIMQPTGGEVIVNGRISALLELGAGFNPEFTGRENVLFQAQVVGLPRQEIDRRLPEIESFADIGEFFEQPVKTYSSGMFVRVAFASAANVDPDILIVDEALAVGDAKFQNKCFLKFREFQDAGKTILLVSHSFDTIIRNTDCAILLEGGRVFFQGGPKEAVDRYFELLFGQKRSGTRVLVKQDSWRNPKTAADTERLAGQHDSASIVKLFLDDLFSKCELRKSYNPMEFRFGSGDMEVVDYLILSGGTVDPVEIHSGTPANIYIKVFAHQYVTCPSIGFAVKTIDGALLYGCNTMMRRVPLPSMAPGQFAVVRFSMNFWVAGRDIFIDIGCGDWSTMPARVLDRRHSLIHMQVENSDAFDGLVDLNAEVELLTISTSKSALLAV
jgi:lipopolysaccharide transport system ATP-binding protein